MAELANLSFDIDYDLKREADALFNSLGMSLSTAITIFVHQAVQEQAMPFQIRLNDRGQFHKLLDVMRSEAEIHGFMTDEEINAEINAARVEIKPARTTA